MKKQSESDYEKMINLPFNSDGYNPSDYERKIENKKLSIEEVQKDFIKMPRIEEIQSKFIKLKK